MYADMTRALREANQTETIRCVVVAGAPAAFSAGNDIGDFLGAALGRRPRAARDRLYVRTGRHDKSRS